jgi:hypothetical protein
MSKAKDADQHGASASVTVFVAFKAKPEFVEQIDAAAEREMLSRSAFLRRAAWRAAKAEAS